MNETIFVNIAAYKDPQLKPTIKDMLEKAKYPENLYVGICWQHGPDENMDEYINNPKFRIKDVDWRESQGVCWARSEIQKLYNNETYTLQLDSHHRFVQDWDILLIDMLKDLQKDGYPKPIITTYAGVYDPYDPKIFLDSRPFKMTTDGSISSEGVILFYPSSIDNCDQLNKPIPARFMSAHFYFTLGQHCKECPYDPNIYFTGEEMSLTIRSFTLGYDLFHPHKLILYHEYTRKNRTKHWDDHTFDNKNKGIIDTIWTERDSLSKKRVKHLQQMEDNNIDFGPYGLGTVRSLHDYEVYAGINFKHRQMQEYTIKGNNPPNPLPENEFWYLASDVDYTINIKWDKKEFDKDMDYKFWLFAIEDKMNNSIKRDDVVVDDHSIKLLSETCEKQMKITVKENIIPYKWIIWPYSKSKEWLHKIEHTLIPSDIINKTVRSIL